MSAMRIWLDRYHVQPSAFRYEAVGNGRLLLKLEFAAGDEAEDFGLEFAPPQRSASSMEGRLRHSVATIRCSLPIPRKARGQTGGERRALRAESSARSGFRVVEAGELRPQVATAAPTGSGSLSVAT